MTSSSLASSAGWSEAARCQYSGLPAAWPGGTSAGGGARWDEGVHQRPQHFPVHLGEGRHDFCRGRYHTPSSINVMAPVSAPARRREVSHWCRDALRAPVLAPVVEARCDGAESSHWRGLGCGSGHTSAAVALRRVGVLVRVVVFTCARVGPGVAPDFRGRARTDVAVLVPLGHHEGRKLLAHGLACCAHCGHVVVVLERPVRELRHGSPDVPAPAAGVRQWPARPAAACAALTSSRAGGTPGRTPRCWAVPSNRYR